MPPVIVAASHHGLSRAARQLARPILTDSCRHSRLRTRGARRHRAIARHLSKWQASVREGEVRGYQVSVPWQYRTWRLNRYAMPEPRSPVETAVAREDGHELAREASLEEIQRLKAAEELFELRYNRKKRSSRISIASQVLVGYVALAGFFVNAYQSYANKQQQQRQQQVDQERWSREFARAQQADKYRAFFETSVLATDPTNRDKRLVGYALLQEFVQDKDYNQKATLMLEESLSEELRANTKEGLDEEHRAAVVAIVSALSQTSDTHALEHAARSVDRIARRHAQTGDIEETSEVLKVYIRRLMGRAADICTQFKDFRAIRRPIRDTLLRNPELLGLKAHATAPDANVRIAETLRDRCREEMAVSGATDCPDILRGYAELCAKADAKELKEDQAACALMRAVAAELPQPTARAP